MKEVHLFIIWSNANPLKEKILEDMMSRFKILGTHTISWDKHSFSNNLTRFYGQNLPPNSNKEKLCGNNPFTLVVVMDEEPLYRIRMTSKGKKEVNVNIFDAKEMYRNWTGGGHKIHGTNDIKEVRHDLVLLTGLSVEDYLQKYAQSNKVLAEEYFEMPGEKKWDSPQQLLYVLNETIDYVILRNFDGLFSEVGREVHGDVDILTSNYYAAQLALNAQPVYKSKSRVRNKVNIGEGGIFFDIRFVGDNYYCKDWEQEILTNRYLHEQGYYVTNQENYMYSLLYHALVHKRKISNDYMEQFVDHFPDIAHKKDSESILQEYLVNFLEAHGYSMVEPLDYSVYFNKGMTNQRMSVRKFILKGFHKFFH
jgi:hypothetical protein